jgi:hydrogenase/urease accessory protein HupE
MRFPRVAVLFCLSVSAFAHELGSTRVSALFNHDGTYQIEIVTDARALVAKLSGGAQPGAQPLEAQLSALDQSFRRRVGIQFDASAATPAIKYSVTSDTGTQVAIIRLSGSVPAGARRFEWRYGWTYTAYAFTLTDGRKAQRTEWLEGGQSSTPYELTASPASWDQFAIAWRYLTLGFTHIVPHGLDHVLFVLGIYLLAARVRSVLWQVSAFTVAHSITLALSIYGIIAAPSVFVEPLIALSIAYVGIENIFVTDLRPRRLALVFGFGLLHGMGFAGVLNDLGLPRDQFVTALITFNLGVEAGQLAVIGLAFLLAGWRWRSRAWYRSRIVVPASAAIACMAVYWTIERVWLAG